MFVFESYKKGKENLKNFMQKKEKRDATVTLSSSKIPFHFRNSFTKCFHAFSSKTTNEIVLNIINSIS